MTDYVPMYDNVGQKEHATSAFTSDVTYAKLSPETLIKKRTVSEQYQVPTREYAKKSSKKSSVLIAAASVLLTLLSVGTLTAVILASVEFQHITKLSIQNVKLSAEKAQLSDQLQELENSLNTMKEEVTNLMTQMSFNKCSKDTVTCDITRIISQVKPFCRTSPLPFNITVSCQKVRGVASSKEYLLSFYAIYARVMCQPHKL